MVEIQSDKVELASPGDTAGSLLYSENNLRKRPRVALEYPILHIEDAMKTQDLKSYISHRDEILHLASEFNLSVVRISHYENYKQLETLIITNNAFKDSTDGIIHISGTHGVEGVAGAGVQISILQNYGKEISESRFGVMFVFALNPFGFHFRRRTSIENIDLNRNCGDGLNPTQRKLAHFFISPS